MLAGFEISWRRCPENNSSALWSLLATVHGQLELACAAESPMQCQCQRSRQSRESNDSAGTPKSSIRKGPRGSAQFRSDTSGQWQLGYRKIRWTLITLASTVIVGSSSYCYSNMRNLVLVWYCIFSLFISVLCVPWKTSTELLEIAIKVADNSTLLNGYLREHGLW